MNMPPWSKSGFEVILNPDTVEKAQEVNVSGPAGSSFQPVWLQKLVSVREANFHDIKFSPGIWGQLATMRTLTAVRFHACSNLGSLSNAQASSFEALKEIKMGRSEVSDERMSSIASLPNLKCLDLIGNPVTDKGISELENARKLETLILVGTRITNKSTTVFPAFSRLQHLSLEATRVTNLGVSNLLKCASVRVLELQETETDEDCLAHICEMKSLEELTVSFPITDRGVAAIRKCKNIKRLFVDGETSDEIREKLESAVVGLEVY